MHCDTHSGADVVCCTCVGSGGTELAGFYFPLLVLDEGSQASEPEALIPLCKGVAHVSASVTDGGVMPRTAV